MKRFSVIAAIVLAAFVGSFAAPVFAQQAAAPAAGEKKEAAKKPMKKVAKKPVKKAAAKDEGMKKDAGQAAPAAKK